MSLVSDAAEYGRMWGWYLHKKGTDFGQAFENVKGKIVNRLVIRRGAYQRPFVHFGMMTIVVLGAVSGPIIIGQYPTKATGPSVTESPSSVLNTTTAIQTGTTESEKPRRDVVEYTVRSGDTVSVIAKNYNVDIVSIKALNPKISVNDLSIGDVIKIPPVSGVIVTIKRGDTIQSLAKKYGLASAQPIADWPYNSFANDETFELAAGQTLVLPGGVMPEEARPVYQTTPSQTLFARGSGALLWPTNGTLTQYFAWYHNGDDIANSIGTPVVAADSGRVILSIRGGYNGGWGTYVKIDHGNGLVSLYGHLSENFVSVGDNVSRGQIIGKMGSTGRSTGSHLHFTVYQNGAAVNPLGLLK